MIVFSLLSFFMYICFFTPIFGSASCLVEDSLRPIDIFYFNSDFPESIERKQLPPKREHNMTCGTLGIDQSCIIVKSDVNYKIKFMYKSLECEKCIYEEKEIIAPFEARKILVELASLGSSWKVLNENNKTVCRQTKIYLGENSSYHLNVNGTDCSLVCVKEPDNVFYPILIAIGIYLLLALLWILAMYLKRKEVFNSVLHRDSLDVSTDLVAAYSSSTSIEEAKKKPVQKRLKSLDTVRGISIVVMIFVNYGGGGYQFFEHSYWNGLTVADLVFPWFMWMMGMSMALSMKSLLRKAVSRKKIFAKIVRRSIILFALGIMLNTYCKDINLQNLRIPGVLQRFGITYFIVATLHLFHASAEDDQSSSFFRDITPYGVEWLIMFAFLATHLLLMFLVHSPDCPAGYLGPGGAHVGGIHSKCTGGAAGYIDRMILGESHLYQTPSFKVIYRTTQAYDPEGILGFLTSVFLVFLGLQAGKILLSYKDWKNRLSRWILWSCLTGSIAAILCLCSKNDGYIPVNKNLWSVSFILATGSLAFSLMSICYFVIDVKGWWNGAPFFYAGMNSILLYVGHEITHNMFPWKWQIEHTHMNELFQDLWGTTLWVLISIWMHYKNFFLAI